MQLLLALTLLPASAEEGRRFGQPAFSSSSAGNNQFLPADQAFQVQSEQKDQQLVLRFTVTPGHYLYKDRFRFQVEGGNLILGQAFYSTSPDWKEDPEFGKVQVYHESLSVSLPVKGNGTLRVSWQGCAEAGLCYPPQSQTIAIGAAGVPALSVPATVAETPAKEQISIAIPTLTPTVTYDTVDDASDTPPAPEPVPAATPGTDPTATAYLRPTQPQPAAPAHTDSFDLASKPLLALLTLWALGLGLAFTPCVLPMLPIVAGIVARQHASNARQGFLLALAYGLGIATSYGLLGGLVSLFGSQANLSLWLQHPVVLIAFSALFVLLALASFEVFHLQLPASWQHALDSLSKKGKAGSFIGTWLMGFFSALVVSPCVSAPLAGVLLSVSTLGKPLLGAAALFSLGLGLSTPLMILGAGEGRFLPKAGLWLNRVKQVFGVLLLGVAVILLARVLQGPAILLLWAALSTGTGFWLLQWAGHWLVLWRSTGLLLLAWGAILLTGAALGGSDPQRPLAPLVTPVAVSTTALLPAATPAPTAFQTLHTPAELDKAIAAAYSENHRLLVDFYADWCVSCKDIERNVFADPAVQSRLAGWRLVRVDITDNSPEARALLRRFNLFGPPAILFFEQGLELTPARIVGEIDREHFERHLDQYFPAR